MTTVPLSIYTQMLQRAVTAEAKVSALEAIIVELTLNPPRQAHKPAVKKELTPEQAAELHAKRVEAGKRGAAKRAENAAAKKEKERIENYEKIAAQIKTELESETQLVMLS
jgi:hypothetical protein